VQAALNAMLSRHEDEEPRRNALRA
jgi:hypothetical protein